MKFFDFNSVTLMSLSSIVTAQNISTTLLYNYSKFV